MIAKIIKILKEKGLIKGIKYLKKKSNGIADIEEQIYTLQWFLNECCDIRTFPKATGNLRMLQECDAALLKIFDTICNKNKLCYWIDHGTLLGARRHSGFIPWDDDMDVAMPRKDYERALKILPEQLKKYGIDVFEFDFRPMVSFGFSFNHLNTGIWLDVFPIDFCNIQDSNVEASRTELTNNMKRYKKYYFKHKKRLLAVKEKKNKLFDLDDNGNVGLHSPEFNDYKMFFYDRKDIFPLSTIVFEGMTFTAPNNVDNYLIEMYGRSYLKFPKTGVIHHGRERGDLCDWADSHNVNMKKVKEQLIDINRLIENENCSD